MKIQHYTTKEDLFQKVFEQVQALLFDSNLVRLALSGGNTPFPLYQKIAALDSQFEIYQVDERYTLQKQFQNQAQIREIFQAPNFDLKLFQLDLPIEVSRSNYSQMLPESEFDFTVLGFGTDGHFASIFDASTLNLSQHVLITKASSIYPIPERLTLSFDRIKRSKRIVVMLVGTDKKEVLDKFLDPNISAAEFPAKALVDLPNLEIHCCF
jgi:6-phosphogluconolactonase